jgi:hypothetical protein
LKDSDTEIKNYNPVPFTWGIYHTISKIEKVNFLKFQSIFKYILQHILIFLDNSSQEFRELNEFLDKKNLDELGFYLNDTKSMSLEKIEKTINEQIPDLDKSFFAKVIIDFNFWLK